MATAEADTSQDERVPPGGSVYDGFISYSHAADDLLAPQAAGGVAAVCQPRYPRRKMTSLDAVMRGAR